MYTAGIVRGRCGAFLLTLLVAVAPMGRFACEVVCAQPPLTASSACHDAASTEDGDGVRGHGHRCGQTHADSLPAVLKADGGRGSAGVFTAVFSLPAERARAVASITQAALTSHGPPGPISLSTNALTTILRI
jgi:hypothetical protein